MPWDDWDDWERYPPSRPREAKGGIRAQSQRGRFAEHWWGERWIAVLESFEIGGRLQRGRSYARRGQVTSLDIAPGLVRAVVQGSRPEPYSVTVKIRPLTPAEWRRVTDVISGRAAYAARLLAGEMLQDIEQAFAAVGLALFPERSRELATACSCPDWSNPCKHVAAVYYLVGEEFDRDPFLLFRLRGLDRQQLMERLARGAAPGEDDEARTCGAGTGETASAPTTSKRKRRSRRAESDGCDDNEGANACALDGDPTRFWHGQPRAASALGSVEVPAVHATLVKRLGRFPFWRVERPIAECVEEIYGRAAAGAFEVFVGMSSE
ncbi:MAG: SWIM zinc finger family protein [Bacteroidales bacterium]